MRSYIYILHTKHGDLYAFSPSSLLRFQIDNTYEYEGPEVLAEAQEVYASLDEGAAWRFLQSRDHWEYEGVSREDVLD